MGWRPRGCAQSGRGREEGREGGRPPAGRAGGPCPRSHSEGCPSWSDTGLGISLLPLRREHWPFTGHQTTAATAEVPALGRGQLAGWARPGGHVGPGSTPQAGIPGEGRAPGEMREWGVHPEWTPVRAQALLGTPRADRCVSSCPTLAQSQGTAGRHCGSARRQAHMIHAFTEHRLCAPCWSPAGHLTFFPLPLQRGSLKAGR